MLMLIDWFYFKNIGGVVVKMSLQVTEEQDRLLQFVYLLHQT